jgi:hypothetical protein
MAHFALRVDEQCRSAGSEMEFWLAEGVERSGNGDGAIDRQRLAWQPTLGRYQLMR